MQASVPSSINVFELIYEKHAALMYGCICKIVPQQDTANSILSKVFGDLYDTRGTHNYQSENAVWFLKYAMKATFDFIKQTAQSNDLPAIVEQQLSEIRTAQYSR